MSGLSLSVGGRGSYQGAALPSAASQAGSATVTRAAFGVGVGGAAGPKTAGLGTTMVGAIAAVLLLFVWHSLPR